jgi:hypothetical protein
LQLHFDTRPLHSQSRPPDADQMLSSSIALLVSNETFSLSRSSSLLTREASAANSAGTARSHQLDACSRFGCRRSHARREYATVALDDAGRLQVRTRKCNEAQISGAALQRRGRRYESHQHTIVRDSDVGGGQNVPHCSAGAWARLRLVRCRRWRKDAACGGCTGRFAGLHKLQHYTFVALANQR